MADLPDVNVWLALTMADHPHHGPARHYWYEQSADQIAFCRVTALGFLRLATNRVVMAGQPLSVSEAWAAYRALRDLPEVVLAAEPLGCEDWLGRWATGDRPSARHWTDAYLAALARAGGLRIVSFDLDFDRFEGVDLLALRA